MTPRRWIPALLALTGMAVALVPAAASAKPLARNTVYLTNETGQDLFLAQSSVQGYWAPDNPPPHAILGSPAGQQAWIEATNFELYNIDVTLVYTLDPNGNATSQNSVTCITTVAVSGIGDSGSCDPTGSNSQLKVIDGPYDHGKSAHWSYTIALASGATLDRSPYPLHPAAVANPVAACTRSGLCSARVRNANPFPVRVRLVDGVAADRSAGPSRADTQVPARGSKRVRFRLKPRARRRLAQRGRMTRVAHVVTRHPRLRTHRNVTLRLRLSATRPLPPLRR